MPLVNLSIFNPKFLDISEIQTHESNKTETEDTHARADELDEYEAERQEHRVSVLFILVIMLGRHFFYL